MRIQGAAGYIWVIFLVGFALEVLQLTVESTAYSLGPQPAGFFFPSGYRFLLRLEAPLTTDGLRVGNACDLFLAHDLFVDLKSRTRIAAGRRVRGKVIETRRRKAVMRAPRIEIGELCLEASSARCIPFPGHRILEYHGSRFDRKDLILPAGTWLEVELQEEWRLPDIREVFSQWEPPEAAQAGADRGESDSASTGLADVRPEEGAAAVSIPLETMALSDIPHYVAHVDRVNLEIVVKDRKGRIIQNLRREDFRVFEDGMEREVLEYSWREHPLSAAILVDQSGSIEPYKKELRQATLTALGELSARDRFTLFFFNHQVSRMVDLTSDRESIAGQIEQLTSSGLTNLFDPILCAAHYLAVAAPEFGHAIILISDNMANTVRFAGEGCALRMALETGTVVYSLRLPSSEPAPLPADAAPSWIGDLGCIEEIAANSGGEVVELGEERDLSAALHQIVQRLRLRYSLSITPGREGESGFRILEVELSPRFGKPNRDYFIAARRGYYYQNAFEN